MISLSAFGSLVVDQIVDQLFGLLTFGTGDLLLAALWIPIGMLSFAVLPMLLGPDW